MSERITVTMIQMRVCKNVVRYDAAPEGGTRTTPPVDNIYVSKMALGRLGRAESDWPETIIVEITIAKASAS